MIFWICAIACVVGTIYCLVMFRRALRYVPQEFFNGYRWANRAGWSCFLLACVMAADHKSGVRFLGYNGEPLRAQQSTVDRQPSIVFGPRLLMDRQPPSIVFSQPSTGNYSPSSTVSRLRFVASSIKDRVHLPSCSYVGQMEHAVEYESLEAAKADGKTPCSRCLGSHMALWGRE